MVASSGPHAERLTEGSTRLLSLVARAVKHGEVRRMSAAQKAVGDEWRQLRDMNCWGGETKAFEHDNILHKALEEGERSTPAAFCRCARRIGSSALSTKA